MESLLKSINEIIDTFDHITLEYGDAPLPASQIEKEINSYPEKPRIQEPFNFAKLNLSAGREQLAAMPDLIRGERLYTNPVAARAVLESSTLALWLLDNRIDEKERVTRGLRQLCDGKKQLKKFHIEGQNAAAVAQIDDFFDNRLPPILTAAAIITLPLKPSIVDMIREVLGDEFRLAYRMLSGFAHGQPSILLTFAYDFDNASGSGGMKTLVHKPKNQIQLYSFHIAVESYKRALKMYFDISDWDFNKISPAFENFSTKLAEATKYGKE